MVAGAGECMQYCITSDIPAASFSLPTGLGGLTGSMSVPVYPRMWARSERMVSCFLLFFGFMLAPGGMICSNAVTSQALALQAVNFKCQLDQYIMAS